MHAEIHWISWNYFPKSDHILCWAGSVATYSYFSYFTCVQVIDFLMVMIILVSHMEMQLWVLANFYDYFN